MTRYLLALAAALIAASPAAAADLFAGVYKHDVNLFTKRIYEQGADVQVGYRFDPVVALGPLGSISPYVLGSINTAHDTDFVAAGISAKLGGPIYVRPGIGLAVHDGPSRCLRRGDRTDLGSRVLFEPEIAMGVSVLPLVSIEASYTHLSHARIFGRQNPGLDMLGLRVNLHLP